MRRLLDRWCARSVVPDGSKLLKGMALETGGVWDSFRSAWKTLETGCVPLRVRVGKTLETRCVGVVLGTACRTLETGCVRARSRCGL